MVHINYMAVLVAAIANLIVAGLWYSPLLFGPSWVAAQGLQGEDLNKSIALKGYVIAALSGFLRAYTLACLVGVIGIQGLGEGLKLGGWIGLGIVAVTLAPQYYFQQKSRLLFLIDAVQAVVAIMVSASIVAIWR